MSATAARPTRIAAIIALLVTVLAACGVTKGEEKDTAREVVGKFTTAIDAGDFQAAAGYTTDPTKAASDLEFTTGRLDDAPVSFRSAEVTASAAEGTVLFAVTWTFDQQTWEYDTSADLRTDEAGEWKIVWAETVIHADLTGGVTLKKSPITQAAPSVVDRAGVPLLTEQLVTVVRLDPSLMVDKPAAAADLAAAIGPVVPSVTTESVQTQLEAATEPYSLVALRPQLAAQVTLPNLPGVTSNQQARLLTPDGSPRPTALARIDEAYQEAADAATGWRITLRDAADQPLQEYLAVQPEQAAANLVTTVDAGIQAAAQSAVDAVPQQAMIVAIQPSNGAILAVAQNPAASGEGPVALTGQYPPGSTFKIITFGAALASGAITPDTVLPCPGSATIAGRTIPNDSGFDLGSVPAATAFAQSCNTTAAGLAIDLDPGALQTTAMGFGLGMDYAIPGMITSTGSVPVTSGGAEQVEAAIGQGAVVASPFGMAMVAATVAAGARPTPMLLPDRVTDVDGSASQPAADVTAALRAMLKQTVSSGTAATLSDIGGLAGKTGTAQFGDGTHSHGWFVGIVGDLAVAVLVVDGGSSGPALSVAGSFLRPAFPLIPGR